MALTSDDLQKIEAVSEKHTTGLAQILASTFAKMEQRLGGVEGTQAKHTEQLTHLGHVMDSIANIQRELLDRHDVRISRVEKQLKLRPLFR